MHTVIVDQESYEISHVHPPQIAKETIHAPKCSKILSEGITKNRQKIPVVEGT